MNSVMQKETLKKNQALIIVLSFYGIMHIFTTPLLLDDAAYSAKWMEDSFFSLIWYYYETWSSRILIEGATLLFNKLPFLIWRLLDTLSYGVIFLCIQEIIDIKGKKSILLAMMVCSYIFLQMVSAGWIATSVAYNWTLAGALYSFMMLKRVAYSQKINTFKKIIYFPIMIYACNHEVVIAISLIIYLLLVFLLRSKSIVNKVSILYIGIVIHIPLLISALFAPGKLARYEFNITTGFTNLSLTDRIRLGIVSTFEHYVKIPNVVFFLFCLVLFLSVLEKKKCIYTRIISFIPLLIDCILTIYYFIHDIILHGKRNYIFEDITLYPEGMELIRQSLIIVVFIIFIICTIYSLYHVFEDKGKMGLILLILTMGFISRLIMAFSPTLFSSGTRTHIFLYFAFIMASGMLLKHIHKRGYNGFICMISFVGMSVNTMLTIVAYLQGHM